MQNMFVFATVSERSQKTTQSTAFRKRFTFQCHCLSSGT